MSAAAGMLVAVVGALALRRKTSAEATQIITEAAGGIVGMMEARITEMRDEVVGLNERVNGLESEATRLRRQLTLYREFVKLCTRVMRTHGVPVPDPPADMIMNHEDYESPGDG